MSNTNQNTQTNSPDREWFRQTDYRRVALTRFEDAVALYRARQYEGSFYMSGYVIEIGAKAKMAELAKTRLSDMTASMIWKVVDEWVYGDRQVPNSEPLTMYEFGEYFYKLAKILVDKVRGNAPPALHTLLDGSTHYQSLSKGRVYVYDADNKERFHAPTKFLKIVGKWAKLLGNQEACLGEWAKLLGNQEACYSEFEKIADEFEKLKWGTSLRYGELEMNNPNEKALKALSIAHRFLKISLLSNDEEEKTRYLDLGDLNLTTAGEHLNLITAGEHLNLTTA